jgi:hypothetical protein
MRWLSWIVPACAATAVLIGPGPIGPSSAAASATYSDSVSGYEIAATSTLGTFAGTASGAFTGAWSATVRHGELGRSAPVTGGHVYVVTYSRGSPALVTGDFTGGSVKQLSGFTSCDDQRYAVNGILGHVGLISGGTGTGAFAGTLTHYRTKIFGYCLIYSAKITGSLTLAPAAASRDAGTSGAGAGAPRS